MALVLFSAVGVPPRGPAPTSLEHDAKIQARVQWYQAGAYAGECLKGFAKCNPEGKAPLGLESCKKQLGPQSSELLTKCLAEEEAAGKKVAQHAESLERHGKHGKQGKQGKQRARSGSCPSTSPPKALLFNHLSKCGGTSMKLMLEAATGAWTKNVTYIKENAHISADDPAIGVEGALIIQEDIYHDLKVNEEDAKNFFVVGLVRKPCDYLLSTWAWMSESSPNLLFRGVNPPYDSAEDRENFAQWVVHTAAHRDRGETFEDGSFFMSSHMKWRYESENYVHCWVRTDKMVDDVKTCMKQYQSCGGKYVEEGLSLASLDDIKKRSDAQIEPTPKASCASFFNSSLMATVMKTESSLISKFNLGSCCS